MPDILGDYSEGGRVQSFVGIVFAISGNVIISLALNCQKLAHKRLEAEASRQTPERPPLSTNTSSRKATSRSDARQPRDTTPLKPLRSSIAKYNSAVSSRFKHPGYNTSNTYAAIPSDENEGSEGDDIPHHNNDLMYCVPSDGSQGSHFSAEEETGISSATSIPSSDELPPPKLESNYLKSKLWCEWQFGSCGVLTNIFDRWLGFALMNIGEIGNFLSYGFAP